MNRKAITLPLVQVEKLMDIAGRAKGLTDTPTLMLFAEVRRLIEEAKAKP